jgi:hypothetical protein
MHTMTTGELWSIIGAIAALQAPIYITLGFIVKQIIDMRVAIARIEAGQITTPPRKTGPPTTSMT